MKYGSASIWGEAKQHLFILKKRLLRGETWQRGAEEANRDTKYFNRQMRGGSKQREVPKATEIQHFRGRCGSQMQAMVRAAGYTDCLGAGPPSPAAGTAPTWAWGWPPHLGQWVRGHPPRRAWGHPGVPSGCAAGMSFLSWVQLTPFEYHSHSLTAPPSAPRIKQKALTQAKILPVKREHCQRLWTPVEILLLLLILCVRCLETLIIPDSITSQRENRKVNTVTVSPG